MSEPYFANSLVTLVTNFLYGVEMNSFTRYFQISDSGMTSGRLLEPKG